MDKTASQIFNRQLRLPQPLSQAELESLLAASKLYPYAQPLWALIWMCSKQTEHLNRAASLSFRSDLLQRYELGLGKSPIDPKVALAETYHVKAKEVEPGTELDGVTPRENRVSQAMLTVKQTFEIDLKDVEPSPKIPVIDKPGFQLDGTVESEISIQKSYADWVKLMVSGKAPGAPLMSSNSEQERKFALLDRFIEKSPKISPDVSYDSENSVNYETQFNLSEIVTETLAELYLKQKKYGKAIKAYKALMVKYPEKSSLFADQIKNAKALKAKE